MLGSIEDSKDFHRNHNLFMADVIPVVGTISSCIRIVVSVGLIALNILRAPVLACVGLGNYLLNKDVILLNESLGNLMAIGYNIAMIAYGILTMPPILGSISALLFMHIFLTYPTL